MRLRELTDREIPTVKAAAAAVEQRLAELESEHRRLAAAQSGLVRELDADEADIRRIEERLEFYGSTGSDISMQSGS